MGTSSGLGLQSVDGVLGLGAPALFAMMALYGAYTILFIVTIWSTYLYQQSSVLAWRLRIASIVMFTVITVHAALKLGFYFVAVPHERNANSTAFIFPNALSHIIPCITGLLSDGLLAWRCFVLWERPRPLKFILIFVIGADALMGSASNVAYGRYLGILFNRTGGDTHQLAALSTTLLLAWVWMFLAVNTLLTASIMWKILYISSKNRKAGIVSGSGYATIIRAIVESSAISWIGLLAFGITSLYSNSATDFQDPRGLVASAMLALLPCIFGISQCLMIARLGLARFLSTENSKPFLAGRSEHPPHRQQSTTDGHTPLFLKFAREGQLPVATSMWGTPTVTGATHMPVHVQREVVVCTL